MNSCLPKSTRNYLWQKSLPKLNGVTKELYDRIPGVLHDMWDIGWRARVFEGFRTREQQREKVQKGYSKTMNSKHCKGWAVDIADSAYGWAGPRSSIHDQFWKDLGEAYKKNGMEWGGDWHRFKDVAHGQLKPKDRK